MPPQATAGNGSVTPGRTLKESSTNQTISLPVSTTNNNNQITSKLNSINLTTTTTNLQQLSKAQSEDVASTTTTATTKFIPCEVASSNCNEKTDLILPTKSEFPNNLEEVEGLTLPLSRETDKSSKKCPLKVSKLQERRRRQQQQLQQQQHQPESVNANNNLSTLTMASGEKRCCPVDVQQQQQQQQQQQHSINHSSKQPSFQNGKSDFEVDNELKKIEKH